MIGRKIGSYGGIVMMRKGWLRHLDFILIDILALELSCALSLLLITPQEIGTLWPLFLFLPFIHFFSCMTLEAYNGILQRGYLKEFGALLKLEVLSFGELIFFFYFLQLFPYVPRKLIICYFLLCFPYTYVLRFLHKFYLKRRYANVRHSRQIAVAATEAAAGEMIKTITKSAIRNYQFFGLIIVDRSMPGEKIGPVPVSSDLEHMIEYIQNHVVDEVFINIPNNSGLTLKIARELLSMGITVHIYMENAYQSLPNRCISNVFGYNVLTSTISPISFRQTLAKRLMDICGGLVGCIITLILAAVIGPIIYIKSPGPIFFSQIRIGKKGRPFKIYKFRSMYMDAEERKKDLEEHNRVQGGLMFKMENDPRIIKGIGNFIRKTSIDEFPQFWNVLKGEMSIVGTRPPTADEYARYSPHHKRRLSMQPGITGLWQVSGRSRISDFEQVVQLDTAYIENWSLSLDIKIIMKTIAKMWEGDVT